MITNFIQLDFNKENDLKVPSVQYDSGSRFVKIKLQQNKVPFEINGYRVTVVANKGDGTEIMNDCTILDGANGLVEFEITEQFNAVEGVVDCQLKLFKGKTLLTSMPFSINVVKSVSTTKIVSSNELKTLVNALGEVQNIDNRFAQTNAQLSAVKEHCTGGNGQQDHSHVNKTVLDKFSESNGKLLYNNEEITNDIQQGSITGIELAKKTVTPNHTTFFNVERVNLFNKDACIRGVWVTNNGNDQSHNSAWVSDYIEVESGETYYLGEKSGNLGLFTTNSFKFYDADKKPMNTSGSYPSIIPSGAKYIRFSMYSSGLGVVMFVKGENPQTYIGYDDNVKTEITDSFVKKAIDESVKESLENDSYLIGDMIQSKTVGMNKLDWIESARKNVLDLTTVSAGYNINIKTGELSSYEHTSTSDFIKIEPSTYHSIFPKGNTFAYYDKSKNYLGYVDVSKENVGIGVQSPNNAHYMRVVFGKGNDSYYVSETRFPVNTKCGLDETMVVVNDDDVAPALAKAMAEFGGTVFKGERKNLCDEDYCVPGTLSKSTGVASLGKGYGKGLSPMIKAEFGETYSMKKMDAVVPHIICFYDSEYNFIKGFETQEKFTVDDENVKYFRATIPSEEGRANIFKGDCNASGEYIPYSAVQVEFTHSSVRDSILNELLSAENIQKLLTKALYPDLYGKKWCVLGDSLTFMGGNMAYHAIVGRYYDMTVLNYGIVSSTIAEYPDGGGFEPMCNRYVNMDDDADIITVMGGTNDTYSKIGSPTDREGDLTLYGSCHKLFKGLCNKYAGKKIGVILPPQHAKSTISDQEGNGPDIDLAKLRAKCEVIREVAHFYSLPVLDLCNEGGLNGFSENHRNQFIQGDKLHITNEGYQVLSNKIIEFLKRL